MTFNYLLVSCLQVVLPLMTRGQRNIEESYWKTYSGQLPLTNILDYQLPPLFHSPHIMCAVKCLNQIPCEAVCIHSKSRCRLYNTGNKTGERVADGTAICFVKNLSWPSKYLNETTSKKNNQLAVITKITFSATESGTKPSVSMTTLQTRREQGVLAEDTSTTSISGQTLRTPSTREGVQSTKDSTAENDEVSMLVYNPNDQSIYHLGISSNSLQKLFRMETKIISAMVYDKISKRLIYTPPGSPKILSCTLDGKNVKLHTNKLLGPHNFAIDEKRNYLFLTESYRHVYRLHINDGKSVKLAIIRNMMHLTVDPRKETFYGHTTSRVLLGKYNGPKVRKQKLKKVVSGKNIKYIALDYSNDVLYIVDDMAVRKMLLTQAIPTVMISLEIPRLHLFFHRNSLYYMELIDRENRFGVLMGKGFQRLHNFIIANETRLKQNHLFRLCGMA